MRFLLICLILSSVLNVFKGLLSEPFPDEADVAYNEELVNDIEGPLISESGRTDEKTKVAFSRMNNKFGKKISEGYKKGNSAVKGSTSINVDSVDSSGQRLTKHLRARSVSKTKKKDTSGRKTRKFISDLNNRIGIKITKVYSKAAKGLKGGRENVDPNRVISSTKEHTQNLKVRSINNSKRKDHTSGEKTRRVVYKINRKIEHFFRSATTKVGSWFGNVTGAVRKGGRTVSNRTTNLVTNSNNSTLSQKESSSVSKKSSKNVKLSAEKNSTTTKSKDS